MARQGKLLSMVDVLSTEYCVTEATVATRGLFQYWGLVYYGGNVLRSQRNEGICSKGKQRSNARRACFGSRWRRVQLHAVSDCVLQLLKGYEWGRSWKPVLSLPNLAWTFEFWVNIVERNLPSASLDNHGTRSVFGANRSETSVNASQLCAVRSWSAKPSPSRGIGADMLGKLLNAALVDASLFPISISITAPLAL